MPRGGFRPGSGPKKGTKYKPRAKKAEPKIKPEKPKVKRQAKKDRPAVQIVESVSVAEEVAAGAAAENITPLEYMLRVMRDPASGPDRRDKMAALAAQYIHPRPTGATGKKEEREDRAKKAGAGRFAPSAPPLKVVK